MECERESGAPIMYILASDLKMLGYWVPPREMLGCTNDNVDS